MKPYYNNRATMPTANESRPLVVIGIDAGDPRFIQEWAEQGHLPAISSVMDNGFWGITEGRELISEHGVWISLLSGVSRREHGYYYFRQLKPGTYELESVTGLDIDAPPFWADLIGRDKKSLIIDAADTRLHPGLAGIQVAHWASHQNWDPYHFATASEPPEVIQEISARFGPKLLTIENHKSTFEEDKAIYGKLLENVRKKGEMCRHLIARDNFDLTAIVFAESHAANHQFWKYHPSYSGENGEENELTHAIRNVYKAIDAEIRLILNEFQNPNTCIVSSVGMEDQYPNAALGEAFCRQLGYQVSPASGRKSLRPLDIARRFLPETLRIAMSKHLPRATRESLVSDRFKYGTDWSKTTAFSIPVFYTSFIRVNLRGREPEGIVEPGEEYNNLVDRIAADLAQLVDPETNTPAVSSIQKTVDLFKCKPHESLPDIFVEWKPGSFMERVLHPKGELTQRIPEFSRRSDHSSHGFFALSGPSIKTRGNPGNIDVLDIAPTLLSLLGEPVPDRMTGSSLKLE